MAPCEHSNMAVNILLGDEQVNIIKGHRSQQPLFPPPAKPCLARCSLGQFLCHDFHFR